MGFGASASDVVELMTLHHVIRLRGVSAICLLVLVPTLQPDYWVVVAVVTSSRRRTLILPRRRRYCLPRRVVFVVEVDGPSVLLRFCVLPFIIR